jgi:hypothetical protein
MALLNFATSYSGVSSKL